MNLFVFNTSFYVSEQNINDWNNWLNNTLLPTAEKKLDDIPVEIFEVVSAKQDHRIFSVQWRCKNMSEAELVDIFMADKLLDYSSQFGENATHFSSVMKRI